MAKSQRIELLDILRGFAIVGTLGTNIWLFANAGDLGAVFGGGGWDSLDGALEQITLFFTNGKFLGMLTILFGVGLEIQYQSARRRGTPFLPAYIWRSVLLFLDGLIHYFVVVEWDILMGYAVTAVLVAFVVSRSDRVIRNVMWAAGGLHLLMTLGLTAALFAVPEDEFNRLFGPRPTVYLEGSYLEQIAYRAQNFLEFRAEAIFIIPMSVFLFLLGVRLLRSGAFSSDARGRAIRGRMLLWGLGLGVPLNLLAMVPELGLEFLGRYLFAPLMAVGYIGLIAQLLERGWLEWVSSGLTNIGRMALSNYMLQNVLASVLFYNWGFGLAQQFSALVAIAAWLGISVALGVFSGLWLRRFSAGPFETVWKYLSELPFRRRTVG